MNLKAATFIAVSCLAFAPAALATGRDRLSYTGVEAAFGKVDYVNSSTSGERFDILASLEIANPVFVSASRTQTDVEASPVPSLRFASRGTLSRVDLGCHFGSDRRVNFVPSVSWVEVGAEFSGDLSWIPDQTENGWATRAAFRALATRWLEVDAYIEWLFIPDDVIPTAAVEGYLYPARHLGVGAGFEASEENRTVTVRVRIVR